MKEKRKKKEKRKRNKRKKNGRKKLKIYIIITTMITKHIMDHVYCLENSQRFRLG